MGTCIELIATQAYGMKPALRATLNKLTTLSAAAYAGEATPPSIDPHSLHFEYAVLTAAGVSREDAIQALRISRRTIEKWRSQLRQAAFLWYGHDMAYEVVVERIMPVEWKMEVEQIRQTLREESNKAIAARSTFATSRGNISSSNLSSSLPTDSAAKVAN